MARSMLVMARQVSMVVGAAVIGIAAAELVARVTGRRGGSQGLGSLVVVALIGCAAALVSRRSRPRPGSPQLVGDWSVAELCADHGETAALDATVAALGEALDRGRASVSALPVAIHVGDDVVEVFWDRPPPLPTPAFRPAPTGWVWTTTPELLVPYLVAEGDPASTPLLPTLVAIGATGLGEVYVNLEACPLVNLVGTHDETFRVLEHLCDGLASPLVDVLAVGSPDPESGPRLGAGVEWVGPEAAVMEARRRRSGLRQHLEERAWESVVMARRRDPMGHEWRPLVVVVPDPLAGGEVLESLTRLARGERSGVSCIFVNRDPDGECLAVVCGDGVLYLPFLPGVAVVLPASASAPEPPVPVAGSDGDESAEGDVTAVDLAPVDVERIDVVKADAMQVDGAHGVEVRVLGPVEIVGTSSPLGAKGTELVAYLACHRDGVSDDRIKTVVWPTRPVTHQTWLNRVSACRQALGADPDGELVLPPFEDGIGCLSVSVATDVDQLVAALQATENVDDVVAMPVLRDALARVRGRPFEERRGYEWAFAEFHVAHAERTVSELAHRLGAVALRVGEWKLALWASEQGLVAVPASEPLAQDRMRAFAAGNDRRGVQRALRDLLASLGAEDPASALQPDTLELYEQLRAPSRAPSGWS